ncbi:MAG: hypothetical protein A2136_07750 [Chloroflexi bacterium RBG_16_54_11]|nr:MAG: hypothetical protein A2136_07750 [Chloroflexi bacterium RBG_16_54_11]
MKAKLFGIQLNADKNFVSRESKTGRILEIRVQAPVASEQNNRPSLNLAIVLDRSGSMQGMKLEYVKQAACHVLDQLNKRDQVALVGYDDTIQVIAHNIKVTNSNRIELKRLIAGIEAGNMTNLCDGWLTGCREIASSAQDETINRALLLTDGLANVGITDLEVLARHAFELYKDSISSSTFGVGEGFNEHLLEAMANQGGGNFYYISTPERIPEIFLKEFNNLIGITSRKVEIKLDLPPAIEWQVLGGWSAVFNDGKLHIYVGDMLTGKLQDVYVKLQIPANDGSNELILEAKAFGQGKSDEVFEEQAKVVFQSVNQKEVEAAAFNKEVMERFSIVELADTATEALKLERAGDRIESSQRVRQNLLRNREYIPPQAAATYERLSNRMETGMTEKDRKQSHWDVYKIKRKKENEEEN